MWKVWLWWQWDQNPAPNSILASLESLKERRRGKHSNPIWATNFCHLGLVSLLKLGAKLHIYDLGGTSHQVQDITKLANWPIGYFLQWELPRNTSQNTKEERCHLLSLEAAYSSPNTTQQVRLPSSSPSLSRSTSRTCLRSSNPTCRWRTPTVDNSINSSSMWLEAKVEQDLARFPLLGICSWPPRRTTPSRWRWCSEIFKRHKTDANYHYYDFEHWNLVKGAL